MTDSQIVSMINDNELHQCELVFCELYRTQFKMVESLVTSKNGSQEDAKDIFQDTIISFYHSIKNQKFLMKCSVSTYLYSIARNLWLKRLKKLNKEVEIPHDSLLTLSEKTNILDCLEHDETQKLIANLLTQTGAPCKKLLYYFYFEKLKMRKIADLMHFSSEQVAKNQKLKCMKKLRAIVLKSPFYKIHLKKEDN